MKSFLLALVVAVSGLSAGLAPLDAEAKRLGGGRAAGMQRQAPPPQKAAPNTADTAKPAQPNAAPTAGAAAAGTAAAAGKRSWMGPIAGLAAGLGLAALASHFGFGEGLANIMTMVLIAIVAFVAIRFLMRRFAGGGNARPAGGMQLAGAGAGAGGRAPSSPFEQPMQRSATPAGATPLSSGSSGAGAAPVAAAPVASAVPAGFDQAGFERIAKMIFIRLQAANDAGNVDDLRKFTTPELFASLRLDLQDRAGSAQQTDVLQLAAEVVDTAQEDGQWIVSVRFHGLIREQAEAAAEPFDELWHLVQPVDGSRDWAIAGITPNA